MTGEPPKGLQSRGRALWTELHDKYEFDMQETDLVVEVCRTLDTIDTLADALARDGMMIDGSQGQPVLHPAVPELRQQQASYARLMTSLNLNAAEMAGGILRATTVRAQTAANARWSKVKAAKRA